MLWAIEGLKNVPFHSDLIIISRLLLKMTDGENARHCAKNTERPIDADQEIGPVLKIEIATVIDARGIEVQVPSLSSPGRSI